VGRYEGMRPFVCLKFRCEDNIKIDLQELKWDMPDRVDLAIDRERWQVRLLTLMFHNMKPTDDRF
jgi:hypothetical protein